MKKIMAATINPCAETIGEYRLTESHEAEFGHEWDGNVRAYILNASEDEDAAREAMAREYTGAIHDLPAGAIVLTAEDGTPLECYWVESEMPTSSSIKIKGLRKACGNTANWGPRSGGYTEIFYDRNSGEVWTVDQISLGHNSWTSYRDPDIIKICETERHMTMAEIREAIAEALRQNDNER